MNNSVYGKTCENQKSRTDIRLVNNEEHCKKLIEKPHCKSFRIFDENLAGVNLRRVQTVISKPFYVGFTVLEISKLHMLRFHYDYIRNKYGDRAQLCFTDTDSLFYEVETEDIYEDMFADKELFDFAGYPKTSKFYDPTNNKVIGKFKDETNGQPVYEFVGLRPKMYSYKLAPRAAGGEFDEKFKAKGIQAVVAKHELHHASFVEQLNLPHENYLTNRRIGSKLHKLYTYETKKRALCAYDDKRFLLEDGIHTLAIGHTDIPLSIMEEVGLKEESNPVLHAGPHDRTPFGAKRVMPRNGGEPAAKRQKTITEFFKTEPVGVEAAAGADAETVAPEAEMPESNCDKEAAVVAELIKEIDPDFSDINDSDYE